MHGRVRRVIHFKNIAFNSSHTRARWIHTADTQGNQPTDLSECDPHSYYATSGGGYNGRLAELFRKRNGAEEMIELERTMRGTGKLPTNTQGYNYLIAAHLRANGRRQAFGLLREMEGRGFEPDVFTFELLLLDLAREGSMAFILDELFALMEGRYGLAPSALCWVARLQAWMVRRHESRVLQLFDEMRRRCERARRDPHIILSLLKTAISYCQWNAVNHMLSTVRPLVPDPDACELLASTDPTLLSLQHYHALWNAHAENYTTTLSALPFLRFLMRQLACLPSSLDEGSYARLLAIAARFGNCAADLAWFALGRLATLYRTDDCDLHLPRHYLEAFLCCIETCTDTDPATAKLANQSPTLLSSTLTPSMRVAAEKIAAALRGGGSEERGQIAKASISIASY